MTLDPRTLMITVCLLALQACTPDDSSSANSIEAPYAVGSTTFFIHDDSRGYDVVAYFTQAKPVEGKRSFTHNWNDAEWRFASAANRDLFAANPEKYAPQYGGWCAWAVSQGYTASIDPEAWRIVDGKLYLNYSKSVQSQWVQDVPGNITKGDRNWPSIKQNLAAK